MTEPPVLFIIRRGADARFRFLQERFAGEPVELLWDRRGGGRRQGRSGDIIDRRTGERRQPPEEDQPEGPGGRRRGERRQRDEGRLPERRRGERRGPVPDTWAALDFVMVRRPAPSEG